MYTAASPIPILVPRHTLKCLGGHRQQPSKAYRHPPARRPAAAIGGSVFYLVQVSDCAGIWFGMTACGRSAYTHKWITEESHKKIYSVRPRRTLGSSVGCDVHDGCWGIQYISNREPAVNRHRQECRRCVAVTCKRSGSLRACLPLGWSSVQSSGASIASVVRVPRHRGREREVGVQVRGLCLCSAHGQPRVRADNRGAETMSCASGFEYETEPDSLE